MHDFRRSPLAKYLLLQIPGWILAAVVLGVLRRWIDLPNWGAAALFLAWVVKDLMLFPFLRPVYEARGRGGIERLIGVQGTAEERLAPSGYIRIGGELWRAEALQTDISIPRGSRVRVQAVRGLTLLIHPEE
jgi:membrane protein implicated in regulation of membrane protease activity